MIFGLVLILFIVIFLAFFVGNNLSNVCTLWLFKTFDNMPVAMLVFISFAVGIVFSLVCVFIGYLRKKSVPTEELTPEQKIVELQKIKEREEQRKIKLIEKQKKDEEKQAQKAIKLNEKKAKLELKKVEEQKNEAKGKETSSNNDSNGK
ncbi:MAG: phage holin family protein [Treponema sp.]|nr:phage holin family protein [Treponema sp.]